MSARRIPVGRDGKQYARVDREDFSRVSEHRWQLHQGYVVRGSRKNKRTLQADVLDVDAGILIDHRNGDKLDNRKQNLRVATRSQNRANTKLRSNNTSGYKGVSRSGSKWVAVIGHRGRSIRLGLFESPQQAALAYDDAARKLYNDFARYNFPQEGELGVHDGPDGFKAPTYVRTTISVPSPIMEKIRAHLREHPGLTVSSFITDAAVQFLKRDS